MAVCLNISTSCHMVNSTAVPDSLNCGEELSLQDWEQIMDYRWLIIGILSSLVSTLGLVGNTLSLLILSRRSMSSVFNHLLACLCTADSLFLFSNLLALPFHFGITNSFIVFIFPFVESCCHFAYSASIFLIAAVTFERWQAVCFPYWYQEKSRKHSNKMIIVHHIIPVVVFALLFNITKFISISPIGPTLQKIPQYLKFILFFQAFHPLTTTGLAPLLILSSLNYKIYSHMRESRKFFHPRSPRTREFQLARMMMVLVLIFLILNCPRLMLGLIEVTQLYSVELCYQHDLDYHIKKETYLLDFAARFLVILNSSINFIIYCLAGSQFRKKLLDILNKILGKQRGKRSTRLGLEEPSVTMSLSRKSSRVEVVDRGAIGTEKCLSRKISCSEGKPNSGVQNVVVIETHI